MTLHRTLLYLWALSWLFLAVKGQGNTACNGTSLNWYASIVGGETPCTCHQPFLLQLTLTYNNARRPNIPITETSVQPCMYVDLAFELECHSQLTPDTLGILGAKPPSDRCNDPNGVWQTTILRSGWTERCI